MKPQVRLWADRGQIGRMQLAARIAHRLIDYFEEYTNMSFPIEKLGKPGSKVTTSLPELNCEIEDTSMWGKRLA